MNHAMFDCQGDRGYVYCFLLKKEGEEGEIS